jgi:two-component system alkaline phosphatase synthesis response regulator PhoP
VKKILIVDDEPFIRALLVETLEDFEDRGVDLLVANDGAEGWKLAQDEHPDLILLDVMLPKLSGYEVCQRIKRDETLSDIHVIMLTAKGQEVDRERGQEVGANEYVTKPFDPDDIIDRAQQILGMSV